MDWMDWSKGFFDVIFLFNQLLSWKLKNLRDWFSFSIGKYFNYTEATDSTWNMNSFINCWCIALVVCSQKIYWKSFIQKWAFFRRVLRYSLNTDSHAYKSYRNLSVSYILLFSIPKNLLKISVCNNSFCNTEAPINIHHIKKNEFSVMN